MQKSSSWPSRSVTERRFSCYDDRQDDVLCAGMAWLLFGFWLHVLNSFLRHAVNLGYYDKHLATFNDLFNDANDAFFGGILYNR